MNSHSQRFHNKNSSIKQKISVCGGDNWLKIHQMWNYVNDVMSSNSDIARYNVRVFDNNN